MEGPSKNLSLNTHTLEGELLRWPGGKVEKPSTQSTALNSRTHSQQVFPKTPASFSNPRGIQTTCCLQLGRVPTNLRLPHPRPEPPTSGFSLAGPLGGQTISPGPPHVRSPRLRKQKNTYLPGRWRCAGEDRLPKVAAAGLWGLLRGAHLRIPRGAVPGQPSAGCWNQQILWRELRFS